MSKNLVEVKNLKTYFFTEDGVVPAVDGVDFSIKEGETLGIVGESGCGKSVTSLSILRLVPSPPGKIVDGEILFRGENLLKKSESEMRKIRGNDISMIFQEPMTSLNPVFTVGEQIAEAIELHQGLDKKQAMDKAVEMLKLVGIPSAEKRVYDFPHQMSGGMRQRVMIAMALSCNPSLLIADEPTTALDVTIQAQILELMKDLKKKLNTSIMLITHDLGVVAEMAENVLVMYAGKVVEYADVRTIFKEPKHPYTIGLMESIPRLDQPREKLYVIEGTVPNPFDMPKGCRFHPRCPEAKDICVNREPALISSNNHQVSCWKYSDQWEGGEDIGI
ncbi:ABC transporter ATP-binding protein [Tepidanaerobacter syntrophicus]|uniref:Oligopeptide transport system ATP-binding protein n=2 Tax=Tepidanaerobacter syntrophicus TaxID=224999 RepID=A0A0U9HI90_9FIRM|nr:ABC transporter ATP-binding protein [Tepidanaerobacter syntrophicus]GAQ25851.1 oligopeptide transport system ATP-binding protein [Tepidanaerobacter syntrophicus]GLI19416.1 peptide ABC transporter ATP-binding protein [Tepidanaerobacter syntrophicus]